jgi:3-oxoacyl-(acyl-carrier-protein) synthase
MPSLDPSRSIAITGLGAFCAAGTDADALWNSALAGKSFATREVFEDKRTHAVCRAPAIARSLPKLLRTADRAAQLAWAAASEGLEQAGIDPHANPDRIGLAIGSSRGPAEKLESAYEQSRRARCKPTALVSASFGSLAGALAQSFGIEGPATVLSSTCASAALAIGWAADQILLGRADLMLAGGTDAPLTPSLLAQLDAAGITGHHDDPAQICRPFAADRTGIVPGEGAGFLIMETLAHAIDRGARPLAILSGWACGTDTTGRTDIDPEGAGLARTIRAALSAARLQSGDIDHINTHGTGTPQNDLGESRAIESVFGTGTPCVSTKPVTGHCMGATPALEAAICIQALLHQTLPPATASAPRDPQCRIRLEASPSQARLAHILSNSSGLWGAHAALVFSKAP